MSRQYSNRPFAPPRHRVSLQMCDYVPYPTAQTNDTSSDSSSWQLTDPLSCTHQPTTASSTTHSLSTPNDFSYFQYPHHRQTLDSSSLHSSNREATNNQQVHQRNESQPLCHFQYLQSHEEEPTRPLLPLNAVTVKKKFFFSSQKTIHQCILGSSKCNSIGSTSPSLSFRKSIGSVFFTPSSMV